MMAAAAQGSSMSAGGLLARVRQTTTPYIRTAESAYRLPYSTGLRSIVENSEQRAHGLYRRVGSSPSFGTTSANTPRHLLRSVDHEALPRRYVQRRHSQAAAWSTTASDRGFHRFMSRHKLCHLLEGGRELTRRDDQYPITLPQLGLSTVVENSSARAAQCRVSASKRYSSSSSSGTVKRKPRSSFPCTHALARAKVTPAAHAGCAARVPVTVAPGTCQTAPGTVFASPPPGPTVPCRVPGGLPWRASALPKRTRASGCY